MFAERHGIGGDDGMSVVGRGDDDGIHALSHLLVHLAIVPEALCLWEFIEHALGIIPVDITQGNDVLSVLHSVDVRMANTANSHYTDVKFVGRRDVTMALAKNRTWSNCEAGDCGCSRFKKVSS